MLAYIQAMKINFGYLNLIHSLVQFVGVISVVNIINLQFSVYFVCGLQILKKKINSMPLNWQSVLWMCKNGYNGAVGICIIVSGRCNIFLLNRLSIFDLYASFIGNARRISKMSTTFECFTLFILLWVDPSYDERPVFGLHFELLSKRK